MQWLKQRSRIDFVALPPPEFGQTGCTPLPPGQRNMADLTERLEGAARAGPGAQD